MPPELKRMEVEHFVRKIGDLLKKQRGELAFFLGAGCSITSGIPGAGKLVERWSAQLHRQMTGTDASPDAEWLAGVLDGHDADDPAASYAKVMGELFERPRERQQEIERIVRSGTDPGFGYAVLAGLLTHPDVGSQCNVVLTTNFDDMVADALYLYTRQKPLVIVHDSLVSYAQAGAERPLVVKIHGDAMLSPRNVADEVGEIGELMRAALARLLQRRGIVFVGYGGNDTGVARFLASLPKDWDPWGVFWVNREVPDNDFGEWLTARGARWVNHLDFDELMVLLRNEFDLPHPDLETRFTGLGQRYRSTFEALSASIAARDESSEKRVLSSAVSKAITEATSWWAVMLAARKSEDSDPARADQIYRAGLERFPDATHLLERYASFLHYVRRDHDRAQEMYQRALAADPANYTAMSNYASFAYQVLGDLDHAESLYETALEGQESPEGLANFGGFLLGRGHQERGLIMLDRAELKGEPENVDRLALEIAFYRFANGRPEDRETFLARLKAFVENGARAHGEKYDLNIERAIADGHPEPELLKDLAAVIADEKPADVLDQYPAWKEAAVADAAG